jgi:hypothetical protein
LNDTNFEFARDKASKDQTSLPRRIRQGFHPTVKQITPPIKYDRFDIFSQRPYCDQLTHCLGRFPIISTRRALLAFRIQCGRGHHRFTRRIVNDLGVDVLIAAKDHEPRALGQTEDRLSHPLVASHPRFDF